MEVSCALGACALLSSRERGSALTAVLCCAQDQGRTACFKGLTPKGAAAGSLIPGWSQVGEVSAVWHGSGEPERHVLGGPLAVVVSGGVAGGDPREHLHVVRVV
jgi:hypothetical protein